VTGDVNVDALEDLVRLCMELDGLRHADDGDGDGDGPAEPAAGTSAAWAALEQQVIGKAVFLLLHSSGSGAVPRR
jgi:hypothetical protein